MYRSHRVINSVTGRPKVESGHEDRLKDDIVLSLRGGAHFSSADIIQLIKDEKLNDYSYSGHGSGCLHWITTLLRLMLGKGLLPGASFRHFEDSIKALRAKADDQTPPLYIPRVRGHFTQREDLNLEANNPLV